MTAPVPGTPEAVAIACVRIAEILAPIGEAVDGYRAQLGERGYSAAAAEQMAVDYHRHLIASAFKE